MLDPYTVYVLRCQDGSHYVGCTSNLSQRLKRHELGGVHYTSDKLPVEVVFTAQFPDKYMAYHFEKYLKSGSGRAFMYKRLVKKMIN